MYIGVPDFISNTMFPVLAAKELRFFQDEGLQVDVQLHTGFRAIQALRDGLVDFYASTAEEPLALFPNWNGAKLLAALAQGTPYVLVMRSDLAVPRNDLEARESTSHDNPATVCACVGYPRDRAPQRLIHAQCCAGAAMAGARD